MFTRTTEQQKRWQTVEQTDRHRCIHAPMGHDIANGNPAQMPL